MNNSWHWTSSASMALLLWRMPALLLNLLQFDTLIAWLHWLPSSTVNLCLVSVSSLMESVPTVLHNIAASRQGSMRDLQRNILDNIWSQSGDGLHIGLVYLECNDKIEGIDRSLKLLYFTIVQDLNQVILTIEY